MLGEVISRRFVSQSRPKESTVHLRVWEAKTSGDEGEIAVEGGYFGFSPASGHLPHRHKCDGQ